jgi:hypothetical protein
MLQERLFFKPITTRNSPPEFNPVLQKLFPAFFLMGNLVIDYTGKTPGAEELCNSDWFQNNTRREQVLRPEASWRRMFPVQPPARIKTLEEISQCCSEEGFKLGTIAAAFQDIQNEGASMGLIYDLCVHLLEMTEGITFFISWHMFPVPELYYTTEGVIIDGYDDSHVENKITLHTFYYFKCMSDRKRVLTRLKISDVDPQFIHYDQSSEYQIGQG